MGSKILAVVYEHIQKYVESDKCKADWTDAVTRCTHEQQIFIEQRGWNARFVYCIEDSFSEYLGMYALSAHLELAISRENRSMSPNTYVTTIDKLGEMLNAQNRN